MPSQCTFAFLFVLIIFIEIKVVHINKIVSITKQW